MRHCHSAMGSYGIECTQRLYIGGDKSFRALLPEPDVPAVAPHVIPDDTMAITVGNQIRELRPHQFPASRSSHLDRGADSTLGNKGAMSIFAFSPALTVISVPSARIPATR